MSVKYLNKTCPVCGGYVVLLDSGSEMCEKCHYILPGSTQASISYCPRCGRTLMKEENN